MSSKATLRTRAATSVDIPAITSLLISALDQDPLFNFNFPHRKEYPQDCFQSWQRILSTWVYEPWVAFLVAEIEEHEEWKIVAFARWSIQPDLVVWDVEQTKLMNSSGWVEWGWSWLPYFYSILPSFLQQQPPEPRHANMTHLTTFRSTVAATDKQFWDRTTGKFPRNVRVTALATHPDYRRRGAAKALVEWGLSWVEASRAKMEGKGKGWEDVVVGVEATKEGRCLYQNLGFEDVGLEELRDEEGEVRVKTWVMIRRYT